MSLASAIREHVDEHRSGMVVDLAFAVGWVTGVTALFSLLDGPQWAYHLCLFGGVVAYFGFFASVALAREQS